VKQHYSAGSSWHNSILKISQSVGAATSNEPIIPRHFLDSAELPRILKGLDGVGHNLSAQVSWNSYAHVFGCPSYRLRWASGHDPQYLQCAVKVVKFVKFSSLNHEIILEPRLLGDI
jgi:hypothetical protein